MGRLIHVKEVTNFYLELNFETSIWLCLDSGGGLFVPENMTDSYKYVIAGIVSYGIGCGRPSLPG